MTNEQALSLFEEANALLNGHFKLSSGLHSAQYLEKFRLVENPRLLEPMCEDLARKFANDDIQFVLGPTTAGIILAYNVARYLGVEARYGETEDGTRKLRRGQVLPAGARVLVVDDILTTGGSIRECIGIIQEHEAVLAGVGVLADRSGGSIDFGARLESVATLWIATYEPSACPFCASGQPITQPGTKGLAKS